MILLNSGLLFALSKLNYAVKPYRIRTNGYQRLYDGKD